VLVDPERRHLGDATLKGSGQMRVESNAGGSLAHLAHRVALEDLNAVALDRDTEGGEHLVEDDCLRIFRLHALGQLRLRAANGFAQFAAPCLEVV